MTIDNVITTLKAIAPLIGFFIMIIVVLWGIKSNKKLNDDKPKKM